MTAALLIGAAFLGGDPDLELLRPDTVLQLAPAQVGRQSLRGPDVDFLRPDAVLRIPDGPTIVFVDAPGSLAVAVRVAIPLVESPSDAGAGYLIQLLAVRRARRLRELLGVDVLASRTSRELVYQVNGAGSDFDHLAGVVRELLARPESSGFVAARTRLENMNREAWETPRGTLHLRLRSRMAALAPSVTGTLASLASLTPARLAELWNASHQASNLTLVVAGSLPPEAALSAFAQLGEAGAAPETVPLPSGASGSRPVPPRPERIRVWYGEAYPAGDVLDPRSEILTRIAHERLPEIESEFDPRLERWEMAGRSWLVLTGAAFERNAQVMRSRIRGHLRSVRASLDPVVVGNAKAALRSTLLVRARSPAGLAEVIGRHMDATGRADAAAGYLERLEAVGFEAMAAFLDEIAAAEVLTAGVGN